MHVFAYDESVTPNDVDHPAGPTGLTRRSPRADLSRRNTIGREAQDTLLGNTELLAVVSSSSITLDADLSDEGDQPPSPMRIP